MRYSYATVALPTLTPAEACSELGAAGFTGIEWKVGTAPYAKNSTVRDFLDGNLCTLDETLEAACLGADAARRAGLAVVGLAPYVAPGETAKLRLLIDMAVAAGAPQVRLQGPRPSAHTASYAHLFEGFAELVASGAEYGRTRGVAIAVELHHHTIIPSVGLALPLLRRFPPGEVGVIYDVGNLVHEGYENHRIALELLGPYLRHVHLKNVQAFGSPDGHWGYRWAHLDNGLVNVPEVLGLLAEAGYQGWVSIEDLSWPDARQGIRFNAAALARLNAPGWRTALSDATGIQEEL
jgi:sugar phosphate isomerase/epimerase